MSLFDLQVPLKVEKVIHSATEQASKIGVSSYH